MCYITIIKLIQKKIIDKIINYNFIKFWVVGAKNTDLKKVFSIHLIALALMEESEKKC